MNLSLLYFRLRFFGFFSKTWILGSDSTKPLEVDSPILPSIAATHWG
jgi:hypothetical protein